MKIFEMKTLLPVVALTVGACASVAPEPAINASNLIEARKTTFGLSAAAFHHMRTRIDSGADVTPLAFSARRLERWAKLLPAFFPPGTGPGTRARDAVWTDRRDFEAKAGDFALAAGRLAASAEANDKASFAAQWTAVDQTCKSCHSVYRAEE